MSSDPSIPAFVVGASGLLAGELLRLLEGHPRLELAAAISRQPDRELRALHPQLSGRQATVTLEDGARALGAALERGPAAVFLGLPHGESAGAYRELARFRHVQRDRRSLGRRLYFAGDYLAGPRFEDAVASGARAAVDLAADMAVAGSVR